MFIFKLDKLQGDIVEILDLCYSQVVSYEYDSWGNILSIKDSQGNEITDTTHIGLINPFRYRGYYYDNETKWYYLNSRYYNPEWGRFLNADTYLGVNKNFIAYNLYAYANNNPVNYSDFSGMFFGKAFNWLKKTYNSVKKVVKKVINAVTNTISKILKPIKENFVIEVGKGNGAELKPSTKGNTNKNFTVSRENNITYKNNQFTCSQTTSQGIELGIVAFTQEETTTVSCYDNIELLVPETTFTTTLGPITWNTNSDLFIGFNFSFNFFISGHIKIGWDIPNTKIRSMPSKKEQENFEVY